jgi:hypothetical protein
MSDRVSRQKRLSIGDRPQNFAHPAEAKEPNHPAPGALPTDDGFEFNREKSGFGFVRRLAKSS